MDETLASRFGWTPQDVIVCDAHAYALDAELLTRLKVDLQRIFGAARVYCDSDDVDLARFQSAQLVAVGLQEAQQLHRQLHLNKANLAARFDGTVSYNEVCAGNVVSWLRKQALVPDELGELDWEHNSLESILSALDALDALELRPIFQPHRDVIVKLLRQAVVDSHVTWQQHVTPLRRAKQEWLWVRRLGVNVFVAAESERLADCLPTPLTSLPAVFPNANYDEAFYQLLHKWHCFSRLERQQLQTDQDG